MPSVINLSRAEAAHYPLLVGNEISLPFNIHDSIWITIHEPLNTEQSIWTYNNVNHQHVHNVVFKGIPVLQMRFWDIVEKLPEVGSDGTRFFLPPSKEDAQRIVDFIRKYPGKNVIVNCKVGRSRSAAVAQYCADVLGYEWPEQGRKRAKPNTLLVQLLKDYNQSLA